MVIDGVEKVKMPIAFFELLENEEWDFSKKTNYVQASVRRKIE
jgi:hypothetical protein